MNSPHNLSYWEHRSYLDNIDYLIIGSGIVGMLAALELKETDPDSRIVILEKSVLGSGASSRNAGFACVGSLGELVHDSSLIGEKSTIEVVRKRYTGLQRLLCHCHGYDVGYEPTGGYEVLNTIDDFEDVTQHLELWNEKLFEITGLQETYTIAEDAGFKGFLKKGIVNHAEGLIDTGKLYKCLETKLHKNDISLLRGVCVTDYVEESNGVVVVTNEFERKITTQKLILCTNAFTPLIEPTIELEPCRNQVLVTSCVNTDHLSMGYHMSQGYIYFREVDSRVLIGGGRNLFPEENNTTSFELNQLNRDYLYELLKNSIIPNQQFTIDYHWSGILSGGVDRQPIVKSITPNVFMGVRLGGMGVAIGSLIASELAQLVHS